MEKSDARCKSKGKPWSTVCWDRPACSGRLPSRPLSLMLIWDPILRVDRCRFPNSLRCAAGLIIFAYIANFRLSITVESDLILHKEDTLQLNFACIF